MLSNIEPVDVSQTPAATKLRMNLPEVKIIHRSLLIAHVDIERKEVNGRQSAATQDLEERRQSVSRHVGLRRRRCPRGDGFVFGHHGVLWVYRTRVNVKMKEAFVRFGAQRYRRELRKGCNTRNSPYYVRGWAAESIRSNRSTLLSKAVPE